MCCERGNTWCHIEAKQSRFLGRGSLTTAKKGERAGSAGPSVSHVVRPSYFFTILYFSSPARGKEEVAVLRAGGQTGVFPWEQHTLTHPPQTAAADWARSLAVCGCFSPISRPSPAAPTVGGRTPTTKRTPRRCLPAGGLAGDDSGPAFVPFGFLSRLPWLLLVYVEAEKLRGGSCRLPRSVHTARIDLTGTSADSTAISPRRVKLGAFSSGTSASHFHNKRPSWRLVFRNAFQTTFKFLIVEHAVLQGEWQKP